MKSWFWLIFYKDDGVSKACQERSELMNAFFSTTRSASPPLLQIMLDAWWKIQPTSLVFLIVWRNPGPFEKRDERGHNGGHNVELDLFRTFGRDWQMFCQSSLGIYSGRSSGSLRKLHCATRDRDLQWSRERGGILEILRVGYVMKSILWMLYDAVLDHL